MRLLGVPGSRAYIVTCCDVLRIWSDRSTLQVIAVGYGYYSERIYLPEEEASMEVARGERGETLRAKVPTTAEYL